MQIIRDDKLVKRNSLIARYTMFGGLIILAGGLFISFSSTDLFWLSLVSLVLGFILSQVGIYYANRFGRSPRPDEILDQALKGLDAKYTLYHYSTPSDHVLVGPNGIWVLLPRPQKGYITYSGGRWKHRGGSLYLKLFAQEGLGRPDLEVRDELRRMTTYLQKEVSGVELPEVRAALVFTNSLVNVAIPEDETPPALTVYAKELKEQIRKSAKDKALGGIGLQAVNDAFQK